MGGPFMNYMQRRTSISIDEAIAILMGYATGPIDLKPDANSDCDDGWENTPPFDLELLIDERDVLEGEYHLAKHEKQPQHVLTEKLAALERVRGEIDQVYKHRCAIEDELNKGERTLLRLDIERSRLGERYITVHSFYEWQERRTVLSEAKPDRAEFVGTHATPSKGEGTKKETKVRNKMSRQEQAILDAIEKLGYDAKALPKYIPTEAGVKAKVWEAVQNLDLFGNYDIYDKAWERLRRYKLIGEAGAPPPKKS